LRVPEGKTGERRVPLTLIPLREGEEKAGHDPAECPSAASPATTGGRRRRRRDAGCLRRSGSPRPPAAPNTPSADGQQASPRRSPPRRIWSKAGAFIAALGADTAGISELLAIAHSDGARHRPPPLRRLPAQPRGGADRGRGHREIKRGSQPTPMSSSSSAPIGGALPAIPKRMSEIPAQHYRDGRRCAEHRRARRRAARSQLGVLRAMVAGKSSEVAIPGITLDGA